MSATTSFLGGGTPAEIICAGDEVSTRPASAAELRLRTAFTSPILEWWRTQVLAAMSETASIAEQGRTLVTRAHEADLGSVFTALFHFETGHVCDRRKAIDVDALLEPLRPRIDVALSELHALGIPKAYTDMLRKRLVSSSFSHRVAGMCAVVLLAALVLADQGK